MVLGGYFATLARMRKTLPNGSIRRRMEIHRASPARPQGTWTAEDPQSSRDPERRLLPPKERMPVAPAPPRLPSMAHRLPLLQKMAYRRHLGENQPGHPRTVAGSPEEGPPAQRRRGGFPVGQEHRGGRRTARLRWRQEGQGQKAPHPGRHRGFRALKAKVHSAKVMDHEGIKTLLHRARRAIPSPVAPVAGRGLPRRGQGRGLGARRPWAGAWSSSSARKSPPRKRC